MAPVTVGVISDTHGLARPEAVAALRASELTVHAGDVGDARVLDELRAIAPTVVVRGNIDSGDWARALPPTTIVSVGELQLENENRQGRWRPLFGKTRSDIGFATFDPRMGWFVTDRIELYGEGTLFLYYQPQAAVAAGAGGLAGRYYLKTTGGGHPYLHGGGGLLWTSLDVLEIDRVFNFQLFLGVGCRVAANETARAETGLRIP